MQGPIAEIGPKLLRVSYQHQMPSSLRTQKAALNQSSLSLTSIVHSPISTSVIRPGHRNPQFGINLLEKFKEIAKIWKVPQAKLKMQNIKLYRELLDSYLNESVETNFQTIYESKHQHLMRCIKGDAKRLRTSWQVAKQSQFGNGLEPLSAASVRQIVTGKRPDTLPPVQHAPVKTQVVAYPLGMKQFSSIVKDAFITKTVNATTPQAVWEMNIPISTMQVFASALNHRFKWEERFVKNFRKEVIGLLMDRKEREQQRPARRLFGIDDNKVNRATTKSGYLDWMDFSRILAILSLSPTERSPFN